MLGTVKFLKCSNSVVEVTSKQWVTGSIPVRRTIFPFTSTCVYILACMGRRDDLLNSQEERASFPLTFKPGYPFGQPFHSS